MSLEISTEGFVGSVNANPAAPVFAYVSPTPNTPPGAAGGFSAFYSVAAQTPVVVQVTDADGSGTIVYLHVMALFLDGRVESVYHLGSFEPGYVTGSSQATITNGVQLTIARNAGWPGAAPGGNLAVGLTIDAVDAGGNVTTATVYYQMPLQVGGTSTSPPPVQAVGTGARDFAATMTSLLVWQFRS